MNLEDVPRELAEAFQNGSVEITRHFWDELRADAFGLADVRCAIEAIEKVSDMGFDRAGHQKFEAVGPAADGRPLAIICAYKDETDTFLLITVYEER